jgi:S-DNA-T family DNA segregation ATPase FtsK/SpoIIIE
MAKKQNKARSKSQKKPRTEARKHSADLQEIKGVVLLALGLALLFSLLSFSLHGAQKHNWLGLMGDLLGWGAVSLFGFGSYLLCLYALWLGWRFFFKKSAAFLLLKTLCIALALFSTCILLSLVEDRYPATASKLSSYLHKSDWRQETRFHLGGAPFYFLYKELPRYNLLYLLNALGVALVFTSLLLASLLFLTRLSFASLLTRLLLPIKTLFALRLKLKQQIQSALQKQELPEEEPLPEHEAPKPALPKLQKLALPLPSTPEKEVESNFLRYVKLRIPGFPSPLSPTPPVEEQGETSNEMLGIQPETQLKSRPSLSRKAQNEKPEAPLKSRKGEQHQQQQPPPQAAVKEPEKEPPQRKREAALDAQRVHNGDFTHYKLPPLSLLTQAKKLDHSLLKKDLKRKAEVLEETLLSFGIEAKVGEINCGPTITSFEVHPAIGVKVQKIKALENDIALNLEAKSIRIIAPIPGKAAVGIEVPNAQAEEVGFKEMLAAYQQGARKLHIPVLLGKAVNGDYVFSDLTKMPHCIIAGATGSGKSVCINTIVMSILLNAKPDEIKLVMVDPKKVELTPYTRLPHMLAPVITEPHGACAAMNWLVKEMEKRYDLLKQTGCRNVEAFNLRSPDKEFEASLSIEVPEKLPYIVGIIDELADLMMVSSSDIETPIARIAQMARAVGIHLILATQRPSREVITGLIKANFPTRISFKVSSRVNSQIVLDDTGAETLLGNGDMLFLPPGSSHLVRAQGAFIRDEDINAVIKMICEQAPPRYLIQSFDAFESLGAADMALEEEEGDALYTQALDIVCSTGNASTTFLQRKLKIGYARAASLIDLLEKKKIVGPADGSKPRKLLVSRSETQDDDMS